MRALIVLTLLILSVPVHAQTEGRVRIAVPTLTPTDANLASQVHRESRRGRSHVQRCADHHSGEREGRVLLDVEVRYGPEGERSATTIEEQGEEIHDALASCLLRAFQLMFRRIAPAGALSVSLQVMYMLPVPPPPPSSAELADAARVEANSARAFGRCYLNAGNRLRAAAQALRGARGRARERAVARADEARTALGLCQLTGSLGVLTQSTQSVDSIFDGCPGCLSAGHSALRE